MNKKLRIFIITTTILLVFSIIVNAAPSRDGFARYDYITKKCVVGGPAGDERFGTKFGWNSKFYTANCHDWYDPSCCEAICEKYDRTSNDCIIKDEILKLYKPVNNKLYFIYAIIIIIIVFIIYFLIKKLK